MADPVVWEGLPKSQTDPATILDAVAAAMAVHNADPDAHLDEGGSLQSHRASDIIDHLAESIYNDKLQRAARRYVAIVDPDSDVDYPTLGEAVTYARSVGGGDIFIVRGKQLIDSDIYLTPLVSLYGEGQGETSLESDSGTKRTIYAEAPPLPDYGYLPVDSYDNATKQVNCTGATPWTIPPIPGMAIYALEDDWTGIYELASVVDANSIRMTTAASPNVTPASIGIFPCATFTEDSTTVVLRGAQTVENLGLAVGMYLSPQSVSGAYQIKSITDDSTIELFDPWPTDTGLYLFDRTYITNAGMTIQDMTIGNPSAKVVLDMSGLPNNTEINSCYFPNGGKSVKRTADVDRKLSYNRCTFDCDGGDYAIDTAEDFVNNCVFYDIGGDARAVNNYYGTTFLACFFYAAYLSGKKWMKLGNNNPKFYGCEWERCGADALGTASADSPACYPQFYSCIVSMYTNLQLSIWTDRVQFHGGSIIHSAGYPVKVESNATDTLFVGCKTTEVIADAGDNTLVIGDVRNLAITAGTSDTAMDLAHREAVYLTPNSTRTLTTSVPARGVVRRLIIATSGTTSYTITLGTGFRTTGTIATGTTTARRIIIDFISDGSLLYETNRTTAL